MYDPIDNEDELRGNLPRQAQRVLRLKHLRSLLATEATGIPRAEVYRRGYRLHELEELRKRGLAAPLPRKKGTDAAAERWIAAPMAVPADPDFNPDNERMKRI